MPSACDLAGLLDGVGDRQALDAGHRLDRLAPVARRAERTAGRRGGRPTARSRAPGPRRAPVLRSRRRRVAGKDMQSAVTGFEDSPLAAELTSTHAPRARGRAMRAAKRRRRSAPKATASAARCSSGPAQPAGVVERGVAARRAVGLNGNSAETARITSYSAALTAPAGTSARNATGSEQREGQQRRRLHLARERADRGAHAPRRPARRPPPPPPTAGSGPTRACTNTAEPGQHQQGAPPTEQTAARPDLLRPAAPVRETGPRTSRVNVFSSRSSASMPGGQQHRHEHQRDGHGDRGGERRQRRARRPRATWPTP